MKIQVGDLQWWLDWRVMVCAPICDMYKGKCYQIYIVIIGPITFSVSLIWHDADIEYDFEEDGRIIADIQGCLLYGETLLQARRKAKRLAKLIRQFEEEKARKEGRCIVCNAFIVSPAYSFCSEHLAQYQEHMKKVESDIAFMKHIEEMKKKWRKK